MNVTPPGLGPASTARSAASARASRLARSSMLLLALQLSACDITERRLSDAPGAGGSASDVSGRDSDADRLPGAGGNEPSSGSAGNSAAGNSTAGSGSALGSGGSASNDSALGSETPPNDGGGCSQSSCGAREVCSPSSGRCEALASDCPMSNASAPEDQDLGIVEVRFDPTGSADIVIENIGGSFLSLPAERTSLCNGADNCIFLVEGDSLTLLPDNRVTRTLPNTRASGGELGIFTADPFADFSFAYIAWGSGAGSSSLEAQAISSAALWTSGARIAIEPDDTGFVCTGDATNPASFVSCNPD